MRAPTHAAFGLLCATGAFAFCGRALYQDWPALGCALLGSLLPDLDSPQSALGRLLPVVSERIERRWGHRSVTHSLLVFLGLGVALLPLGLYRWTWYAALLIGYLSHLVADCATKTGAPLFHPHPTQCVWPGADRFRIHTGSLQEGLLLLVLLGLLLLLLPVSRAGGVWRSLRYLAATPGMAYRDYREATTQTRLEFRGRWRDTHQPVQGTALVLEGRSDRFLIAYEGQVVAYGDQGDILPDHTRILVTGQPVQVDTLRVQGQPLARVLEQVPPGAFVSGRLESPWPLDPGLHSELQLLLKDRDQSLRLADQLLDLEYAPRDLLARLQPRRRPAPERLAALQQQITDQQRALLTLELRRPPVHYLELREAQARLQATQRELEALQDPIVPFSGVLYLRSGEEQ
ncbi:MAG: metal-dependent hydrolase [Candidatus Latescibacteria bacterium]|nr:metal-dependent hydrolase [Candidatus Latescibacterota bacterium]